MLRFISPETYVSQPFSTENGLEFDLNPEIGYRLTLKLAVKEDGTFTIADDEDSQLTIPVRSGFCSTSLKNFTVQLKGIESRNWADARTLLRMVEFSDITNDIPVEYGPAENLFQILIGNQKLIFGCEDNSAVNTFLGQLLHEKWDYTLELPTSPMQAKQQYLICK